jgi:DNA processing protein
MELTELEARVLLNMVPSIGPVKALRLIERFGGAAEVFGAAAWGIEECGISAAVAAEIIEAPRKYDVRSEMERARAYGAKIFTTEDAGYPELLSKIYDPPLVIYVCGELGPRDGKSVAVVGTRRPTAYGRLAAEKISGGLAASGIMVVSGLASGIDTAAHSAALDAGGRTVAVLGSGLGVHFPAANEKLEEKIARSGAIVSEFPMGFPPSKGTFPRRNRIISGLSLGTVVVEAPEKSGALITAMYALEQGRDVFAVPGSVVSRFSRGPHWLIKQGAKLVESAQDVLEEIGAAPATAGSGAERTPPAAGYDKREKEILGIIDDSGGADIDSIKNATEMSFGDIFRLLVALEMKGAVKPLPGKVYVRI